MPLTAPSAAPLPPFRNSSFGASNLFGIWGLRFLISHSHLRQILAQTEKYDNPAAAAVTSVPPVVRFVSAFPHLRRFPARTEKCDNHSASPCISAAAARVIAPNYPH